MAFPTINREGWTVIEGRTIDDDIILSGVDRLTLRNLKVNGKIRLTDCAYPVLENVIQYQPDPTGKGVGSPGILLSNCNSARVERCQSSNNYLDGFKTNQGNYGRHIFAHCVSYGNGNGSPEGTGYDHFADGGDIIHDHCASYDNNGVGLIFKTYDGSFEVTPNTKGRVIVTGYHSLRDTYGIGVEGVSEIDYPSGASNPGWPRDLTERVVFTNCMVKDSEYSALVLNAPRITVSGGYFAGATADATFPTVSADWHFDGDMTGIYCDGILRARGCQSWRMHGGRIVGDLQLQSAVGYRIQEVIGNGFKLGGTIVRMGLSPVVESGNYF